ncbi:MAG: mannose-6-phosphate isomerase, class I [Desulfatitalea sp.]|nr:mannose-6-phosphate isomerase, class I [Desulfatitalea sp.]
MNQPLAMENTIQPYAWGSRTAIAELLGRTVPADHPQAELWMGAHPKAPSRVWYQGRWQNLNDLLTEDPVSILGSGVMERFGAQLPFLFKVLAVDQPLSIQAHPDQSMAEQGFARENAQGIPLAAPHRNYRDAQHKPELVCALTPFWALCGFRTPAAIRDLIDPLWPDHRRRDLDELAAGQGDEGLRTFFVHLMTLAPESRRDLMVHIVPAAKRIADRDPVYDWMVRLYDAYPDDVGVLSPTFLHLVRLAPGQALFLPAGRLHAYLSGVAIELMANSDNVLRGGLTPKHVDVPELLRVLDFHPKPVETLHARSIGPHEQQYPSSADEFSLSVITLPTGNSRSVITNRPAAPEILLCTDGAATLQWPGQGDTPMPLPKGTSALIPATVSSYTITGPACVYRAGVNTQGTIDSTKQPCNRPTHPRPGL